jgi:hypothetical protein
MIAGFTVIFDLRDKEVEIRGNSQLSAKVLPKEVHRTPALHSCWFQYFQFILHRALELTTGTAEVRLEKSAFKIKSFSSQFFGEI